MLKKVKSHGKEFHIHGADKIFAPSIWIHQRRNGKMSRIKVGVTCFICGVRYNDRYKRMQLAALERVLGAG